MRRLREDPRKSLGAVCDMGATTDRARVQQSQKCKVLESVRVETGVFRNGRRMIAGAPALRPEPGPGDPLCKIHGSTPCKVDVVSGLC